MGGSNPKFLREHLETTLVDGSLLLYLIGSSQTYNYVQESLVRPHKFSIFDVRTRNEFETNTLIHAKWAWDHTSLPRDTTPTSITSLLLEDRIKFFDYLKDEVEDKLVIVFGEESYRSTFVFLRFLLQASAAFRAVFAVKDGLGSIKLIRRYASILTKNEENPSGPFEILHTAKREGRALLVTGIETLKQQERFLKTFGITTIINVSKEFIPRYEGVCLKVYSSVYGSPNLEAVTRYISKTFSEGPKRVLIVDGRGGCEYAATICVLFLSCHALTMDLAIRYVKQRKLSADENFLFMAYTCANRPIKTATMRKLFSNFKKPNPRAVVLAISELEALNVEPAWAIQSEHKLGFTGRGRFQDLFERNEAEQSNDNAVDTLGNDERLLPRTAANIGVVPEHDTGEKYYKTEHEAESLQESWADHLDNSEALSNHWNEERAETQRAPSAAGVHRSPNPNNQDSETLHDYSCTRLHHSPIASSSQDHEIKENFVYDSGETYNYDGGLRSESQVESDEDEVEDDEEEYEEDDDRDSDEDGEDNEEDDEDEEDYEDGENDEEIKGKQ